MGAVQLVIEDDGKPRTVANGTRNGHGLHNIRMRLENLRGDMRTEPLEPVGTRNTITIWLRWIHQL